MHSLGVVHCESSSSEYVSDLAVTAPYLGSIREAHGLCEHAHEVRVIRHDTTRIGFSHSFSPCVRGHSRYYIFGSLTGNRASGEAEVS